MSKVWHTPGLLQVRYVHVSLGLYLTKTMQYYMYMTLFTGENLEIKVSPYQAHLAPLYMYANYKLTRVLVFNCIT